MEFDSVSARTYTRIFKTSHFSFHWFKKTHCFISKNGNKIKKQQLIKRYGAHIENKIMRKQTEKCKF